jgi:GDSL-like Lipase/Acylhydrolase family
MKREHAFWLLMVTGSFAVIAMSIELFVRVFVDNGMQYDLEMWKYARDVKQLASNPLIGHGHRPNTQAQLMGVDVKINSKGLREREIPYDRTPSVLRIVMLGDSFTEGWGVPLEQTFPKRIEGIYGERGIAAEVINAGVGNYNTIMEVNYFLDEGYKYRPDIVVLNYIPNDAETVPPHAPPTPLLRICASCVYLFGRLDTLMREVSVRADWETYYLDLYGGGSAKGWLDAKASIGKLAEYARSHHIKLLISYFPDLRDLRHDRLKSIGELVRQAAEESGASFVDTRPELTKEDPMKLWVAPTDPHPNARANELIARALFRKLETME